MEKERKSEEGGGGQAGEGGGGDIQRQVLPSGQVTIAIAPFTESGSGSTPTLWSRFSSFSASCFRENTGIIIFTTIPLIGFLLLIGPCRSTKLKPKERKGKKENCLII